MTPISLARPTDNGRIHASSQATAVLAARTAFESIYGTALVCSGVILLLGQTPSTERLCYALTALLVAPASVLWTWHARGLALDDAWQEILGVAVVTVAALVATRLLGNHRSLWLLVLLLLGRGLLISVLRTGRPAASVLARRSHYVALPALAAAGAAAFSPSGTVGLGRLAFALAIAAAVALGLTRSRPISAERFRVVVDVTAALLILLLVFQLAALNLTRVENMAYFLGPTNDVLHGQPMLVDTFSQYGVGMYDVLSAVFSLLPLGFGVFSLLLAAASSLLFLIVYVTLRLSIQSQLVAVFGAAMALTTYIYAGKWLYLDYPSTAALRFGLPWLLVMLILCSQRARKRSTARALKRGVLVLVGLAAVWSGEVGAYCLGAAAAMALTETALLDAPLQVRARAALQRVLELLASVVIALALFTLLTRALAGSWPQWGPYLALIKLYTVGGLGLLPIQAWSPGIAVGAMYAGSIAVLATLIACDAPAMRQRLTTLSAIAGVAVMGALEFTYFLGRAAPSNLIHVSVPAVTLAFIWLGFAHESIGSRRQALAALGASAGFLCALIVAGDYVNFGVKFGDSALGALVESPRSARAEFERLADNHVFNRTSSQLERFINSLRPNDRQLTLVAWPSVETETLIRLGRDNPVGTTNPCQEALSPTGAARVLTRVRDRLVPGGLLVVYQSPRAPLIRLQNYELHEIRSRFEVREVATSGHFRAYVLQKQRASWRGGASIEQPRSVDVVAGPGCA